MKSSVSHDRPRFTVRLQVLAIIAGMSVPLLSGCPGALEGKGWPPPGGGATASGGGTGTGTGGMTGSGGAGPAPCDAPAMIFPSCVNMSCHLPMGIFPPELSATSGPSLKTKMGFSTGPCMGQTIINPSDKANSTLLKRVEGTTCGSQMPSGMAALTAAQITCLTDWVKAQ